MKRTQRTMQAAGETAVPEAVIQPREAVLGADGDAVNVAEANREEPTVARLPTSAVVNGRGMHGEKCRELGRPPLLRDESPGRSDNQKEEGPKAKGESERPIVLGGRESLPHGEGAAESPYPAKETAAGSRPT